MEAKLYLTSKNFSKLKKVTDCKKGLTLKVIDKEIDFVDCVIVFDKVDDLIIKIIDVLK